MHLESLLGAGELYRLNLHAIAMGLLLQHLVDSLCFLSLLRLGFGDGISCFLGKVANVLSVGRESAGSDSCC